MATRAIVPRADNEGSLGTESKRWNNIQTEKLNDVEMPIDPPTIEDAGKSLCLNFDGSGYEYRNSNLLPLITENDANKILAVKSDSSDTEWVVADYVPTSSTTTTPTASSIPIADSGGKIDDGWIPATVARTESPTFTGTPAAPTAPSGTSTGQIATTEFVKTAVDYYLLEGDPA